MVSTVCRLSCAAALLVGLVGLAACHDRNNWRDDRYPQPRLHDSGHASRATHHSYGPHHSRTPGTAHRTGHTAGRSR